jgi:chemotaxis signal transduction protein
MRLKSSHALIIVSDQDGEAQEGRFILKRWGPVGMRGMRRPAVAARRHARAQGEGETVQQGEHVEMTPSQNPAEPGPVQELLMTRMGGSPYLIRLQSVAEIVRPGTLSAVPMAPDHLLGLANVHGQIVCIIDPCRVLRLEGHLQPLSARTRYVVLRHPRMHVGIWVDEVASIYRVPQSDLPQQGEEDEDIVTLGPVALPDGGCALLNARALFR